MLSDKDEHAQKVNQQHEFLFEALIPFSNLIDDICKDFDFTG